jgi:hypothetical protein
MWQQVATISATINAVLSIRPERGIKAQDTFCGRATEGLSSNSWLFSHLSDTTHFLRFTGRSGALPEESGSVGLTATTSSCPVPLPDQPIELPRQK